MKTGWNKERQIKYPDVWKKIKKKISIANKGKHYSIKTEFKNGRKVSEETKRKMSKIMKKNGNRPPVLYREKHPRWKGGYEYRLWCNRQRRIKRMGNIKSSI